MTNNKGYLRFQLMEESLIKNENRLLMWPILGGISIVMALITDDHVRHIKSHLKFFYNPFTWFHIFDHWKLLRAKRRAGIEFLTNDLIIAKYNQQVSEQQQAPEDGGGVPDESETKKTQWH